MTTQIMTDKERWSDFVISTWGYALAFGKKSEPCSRVTKRQAKELLIKSVAYLTTEQKRESVKELEHILTSCDHDEEEFKHLISNALLSSEIMECMNPIVTFRGIVGKNTCYTEEATDLAYIDGKSPNLILYRDSDTGERRWYIKRGD